MAATFNLLRGRDLIWNYVVNNYLMGTRLCPVRPAPLEWRRHQPAGRWHRDYLADFYRDNLLAKPGRDHGEGRADRPRDRDSGLYPGGTRGSYRAGAERVETDQHFAGPLKFVLAGSGHIAGVVNPPSAGKYQYWTNDEPRSTLERFRRRCDRAQGQLVARLDRNRLNGRAAKTVPATRARVPRQGQAQGDRGCAGALCENAIAAHPCLRRLNVY
jgi:polyhydroxyalkanoate synthase